MKVILVARAALWLLFSLEALVLAGVVDMPSSALTWPWLLYLIGAYLLLMELPLFLTRSRPDQQRHFTLLAVAMVVNHVSDAPGQLIDLYRTSAFYDKVLHATSLPFLIGAFCLGVALILRDDYGLERIPVFVPCFIVLAGMFLSVTHEFIELTIDLATASNAGTTTTDIHDTALDLAADLVGLLVFAAAWSIGQRRWGGAAVVESSGPVGIGRF